MPRPFARRRLLFHAAAASAGLIAGCAAEPRPLTELYDVPALREAPIAASNIPKSPTSLATTPAVSPSAPRPEVIDVGSGVPLYQIADNPLASAALRTLEIHAAAPDDRHVVVRGETLIAIARERLGDAGRWRDIVALNPGVNPSALSVGQSLVLPN